MKFSFALALLLTATNAIQISADPVPEADDAKSAAIKAEEDHMKPVDSTVEESAGSSLAQAEVDDEYLAQVQATGAEFKNNADYIKYMDKLAQQASTEEEWNIIISVRTIRKGLKYYIYSFFF